MQQPLKKYVTHGENSDPGRRLDGILWTTSIFYGKNKTCFKFLNKNI